MYKKNNAVGGWLKMYLVQVKLDESIVSSAFPTLLSPRSATIGQLLSRVFWTFICFPGAL